MEAEPYPVSQADHKSCADQINGVLAILCAKFQLQTGCLIFGDHRPWLPQQHQRPFFLAPGHRRSSPPMLHCAASWQEAEASCTAMTSLSQVARAPNADSRLTVCPYFTGGRLLRFLSREIAPVDVVRTAMEPVGGISVMNDFLEKFYPEVLLHKHNTKQDNYCKYRNDVFQLYSSCHYISALLATLPSAVLSRRFGRKPTLLLAGLLFIGGTVIGTAAQNLGMLLSGRMLLGFGLGFSSQAVNLYLAEIAPPRLRGALHYIFGLYISFGILAGNIVNYLAQKIHPWGWRLSLGVAGVPAILLTVSSLLVVESPSSLIQRGHHEQAKKVLAKLRGSTDIQAEFLDLLDASKNGYDDFSSKTQTIAAFRNLVRRNNIPSLVIGIAFPFFQQMTGNDAIVFYGAFLFKIAGFGDQAALYSAVITGATSFLTAFAALIVVDRCGRRRLLFVGAGLMASAMVVMACIFATGLPGNAQRLPKAESVVEVVVVCIFLFGFSGSLGLLAWLIPSEVFPLEVRSAGLSVTVCVNMLFKFLIAQTFLSMLCAFKYGIFLFFAGWLLLMALFLALFVPETKGIPLHAMHELWAAHWFWKRVVPPLEASKERGASL